MSHKDKQPSRASKAGVPPDKRQPASDVAPRAAKGGDKENNSPLPRRKQSSGLQSTPGRKPGP
jgi:hypothetical protein